LLSSFFKGINSNTTTCICLPQASKQGRGRVAPVADTDGLNWEDNEKDQAPDQLNIPYPALHETAFAILLFWNEE
jgi:hypothetical protein